VNCCPLAIGTGGKEYTSGVKNKGEKWAQELAEKPNEAGLLRRIERAVRAGGPNRKGSGIRLGIGDDAALWAPRPGYEVVLTTDWFLEGTHFLRNAQPPDAVGWKSLARAVSDVAAMGGEPRCCLVSLALPLDCTKEWLNEFMKGLTRCSRALGCPIVGGDTTRWKQILLNVCVIGEVKSGRAVLRSGAQAGDRVFVSGRLGEAELGLRLVKRKQRAAARANRMTRKHLRPVPRTGLGIWLGANGLATAMMDLSDGLSSDLARLCAASGVGARINAGRLPTAAGAFSREFSSSERLHAALHGGDDYELLFCVGCKAAAKIPAKLSGVELTEIGEIQAESGIRLVDGSGEETPLRAGGWDPFRK
jgi:thiamine-monophosphate kinase